jgi:protocatechuate 3,4-dioxygenase beta subunit
MRRPRAFAAVLTAAAILGALPSIVATTSRVAAQQSQTLQGSGTIAGHVTRVDTGKPIANATVMLVPRLQGVGQPRGRTDANGRFEFTSLSAGTYLVMVTADGFVSLDATVTRPTGAGTTVDLHDGERMEKVDVQLALPSAIDGRVLDEFGGPAPGVTIQLAQMMVAVGTTIMMPGGGTQNTGPTDDEGHFRFYGLPPGEYYVMALSGPFGRPNASAFSSSGDGLAGFAPTYYPGTDKAADAKPVVVEVGKDSVVTFALTPARMVTVSGRVTDVAGQPVRGNLMLLQTQGGVVRSLIPANTTPAPDGTFSYRNVAPGTYVLQGFAPESFGTVFVTVPEAGPAAVTDVVLIVHPLTTARGHITFEGGTPPQARQVYAGFLPTDFTSGPVGGNRIGGPPNDDWTFAIDHLAHRGVVRITAPPPWTMKSVTLDGQDIADVPSDFQSHDVKGLEVVMTTRVASLVGTVIDGDTAAPNSFVLVFPEDRAKWIYPGRLMARGRANAQAAFTVPGLLPGQYRAIALSTLPVNVGDPVWLQTLVPLATPFSVSEGGSVTLTLKLVKR